MQVRNQERRTNQPTSIPEVFSPGEVALAAGVPVWVVRQLIATAEIPTADGELILFGDALTAVEALRLGRLRAHPTGMPPGVFGSALFNQAAPDPRPKRLSVLVSTGLHASALSIVALFTTAQLITASDGGEPEVAQLARLVFVAEPGPGGGGGGGGLRMPLPAPTAERAGASAISSPAPERVRPRRIEPVEAPEPPRPLDEASLPLIFAPLASARAHARDVRGLLLETAQETEGTSQGPGDRGGVGDGHGTGIGEGEGSGVGPGSGGGIGGGPYRPGSGITPPRLLHEARPDYTEPARRRGLEGDVLLEIVVLSDGSVGSVTVLQRLGDGLDERAVEAVRQWRFVPAERFGTPVDVLVEVAVEFRLR